MTGFHLTREDDEIALLAVMMRICKRDGYGKMVEAIDRQREAVASVLPKGPLGGGWVG